MTTLYFVEGRQMEVLEEPGQPPRAVPLGHFLSEVMSGRIQLENIASGGLEFRDPMEDYYLLGVFANCLIPSEMGGKRGNPRLLYARCWQNRDEILKAGALWAVAKRGQHMTSLASDLGMTLTEASRFIAAIQEDLSRQSLSLAGRGWLELQRALTERTAPHNVALEIQRPLKEAQREDLWRRWHNAGLRIERHDVPFFGYRAVHPNALMRAEIWWLIDHEIRLQRCNYCRGPYVPIRKVGRPSEYCPDHRGAAYRKHVERGTTPNK